MSHDHVYQARLVAPAGRTKPWEIRVDGVGVTQSMLFEDAPRQAADLVAIMHPELDPTLIRIEFVR